MQLPEDPYILLGVVNCALRDGDTPEEFAARNGTTVEEIEAALAAIGYRMSSGGSYPQFRCE